MARISKLANPEFAKAVAEAYINGVSRDEMAVMFGAHKDTITAWCRDPRVQNHAARMAQDRVTRITRRIDAEIEGRLAHVGSMDVELLLKVRKEYLDRALKIDLGAAQNHSETVSETIQALEDDPELADALRELLSGERSGGS